MPGEPGPAGRRRHRRTGDMQRNVPGPDMQESGHVRARREQDGGARDAAIGIYGLEKP